MKRIDASKNGIFDIAWSSNGEWLTYVLGEDEVRMANVVTGDIRTIGKGRSPNLTNDKQIVLERDDEILLIQSGGEKTLISKKDIVRDTPKQAPLVSPNSERILFRVCNIADKESQQKNAYPYRHFYALAELGKGKAQLTTEQWYGGISLWFPDSTRFAHFEFDSTAGPQVHIVKFDGTREGTLAGLYPAVSPDGLHIAARPRGGGSLVVYSSKGSWDDDNVETSVMRIPGGAGEHNSANPPIWLDNRLLLVDEGDKLWRVDSRRDKAEEMKKLPMPTMRRKHSMAPSPARDLLAIEVESEENFELRLVSLK